MDLLLFDAAACNHQEIALTRLILTLGQYRQVLRNAHCMTQHNVVSCLQRHALQTLDFASES